MFPMQISCMLHVLSLCLLTYAQNVQFRAIKSSTGGIGMAHNSTASSVFPQEPTKKTSEIPRNSTAICGCTNGIHNSTMTNHQVTVIDTITSQLSITNDITTTVWVSSTEPAILSSDTLIATEHETTLRVSNTAISQEQATTRTPTTTVPTIEASPTSKLSSSMYTPDVFDGTTVSEVLMSGPQTPTITPLSKSSLNMNASASYTLQPSERSISRSASQSVSTHASASTVLSFSSTIATSLPVFSIGNSGSVSTTTLVLDFASHTEATSSIRAATTEQTVAPEATPSTSAWIAVTLSVSKTISYEFTPDFRTSTAVVKTSVTNLPPTTLQQVSGSPPSTKITETTDSANAVSASKGVKTTHSIASMSTTDQAVHISGSSVFSTSTLVVSAAVSTVVGISEEASSNTTVASSTSQASTSLKSSPGASQTLPNGISQVSPSATFTVYASDGSTAGLPLEPSGAVSASTASYDLSPTMTTTPLLLTSGRDISSAVATETFDLGSLTSHPGTQNPSVTPTYPSVTLVPTQTPALMSVVTCPTPKPTHSPTEDKQPFDFTWGCPPEYICEPPQPASCNIWAGPPLASYICQPQECLSAPPLILPTNWGINYLSNATTYFQPSPGYYNLDPEAFGLSFDIFVAQAMAVNITFDSNTIESTYMTGNWASQASLTDFPAVTARIQQKKRQSLGSTIVPAICYAACNAPYLEALRMGKTKRLCTRPSAFLDGWDGCKACVAANEDTTLCLTVYVIPQFQQWLNYCAYLNIGPYSDVIETFTASFKSSSITGPSPGTTRLLSQLTDSPSAIVSTITSNSTKGTLLTLYSETTAATTTDTVAATNTASTNTLATTNTAPITLVTTTKSESITTFDQINSSDETVELLNSTASIFSSTSSRITSSGLTEAATMTKITTDSIQNGSTSADNITDEMSTRDTMTPSTKPVLATESHISPSATFTGDASTCISRGYRLTMMILEAFVGLYSVWEMA